LSEAVALVDAGIRTSLFIAAPFYPSSAKLNRAEYVAERSDVLLIAVDDPHIAEHLGEAMASHRSRVEVLIEVDSGLHRSGVAAESVADVARASSLKVSGVFTHGGHGYPPGRARHAASDEVDALARASEILSNEGFDFDVVSAGSTPTAPYCGRPPVTEIRPGTYVYGDWQMVQNGVVTPEDVALAVATTVISVSRTDNRFVVDAGAKILTKDSPDWVRGYGHIPELSQSTIERVYDNHGVVSLEHGPLPAVGEKLIVIPNHVCPVVNLVDFALVVDAEGSVSEMPIDLRGCLR
jgi:D-serine deaminase-like pyridoxal phosphate-dependent protein